MKQSQFSAAMLLTTAVLAMPFIAWDLALRPPLMPVFWTLAVMSLYLVVTWSLRTAGHWLVKTLAALVLLGVGGLMAAVLMLAALASQTGESLPLADGCRVEIDVVGGFGDTDHHVLHRCTVAGLWERSTPLLSDTGAALAQLRAAAPAADGAMQVAVTQAVYGQPDKQRLLRIPPR